MSVNGIWHSLEPRYPFDPELNRNGSRADWLLADGTFVEAAGLMTDVYYREKMEQIAKESSAQPSTGQSGGTDARNTGSGGEQPQEAQPGGGAQQ